MQINEKRLNTFVQQVFTDLAASEGASMVILGKNSACTRRWQAPDRLPRPISPTGPAARNATFVNG